MIATLLPAVRPKAQALCDLCDQKGIWFKITCGYRSSFMQNLLYAQGRWLPGGIVTNAKGGLSMHQYRIALDFVPADGKGLLHWDDINRIKQIAQIGESLGATYGGNWPMFHDNYHLEWLFGHPESYFINGGTV